MYIIVCMHIYRIVCMQIGKNLSMYSCVVHMKYCISDLHYVLYSTLYLRECGDFLRIYLLLSICIGVHPPKQCRRPGAEFWGGTETFFADQDFWITFFRKKFPFHCKNFWWPFFSHRPGFSDFSFLFPNFPYLTMLNVVYDPFLKRKTPFLLCSCASNNTTSQNIGGTDAWTVPTSNFGEDRPPSSPIMVWVGLRPCLWGNDAFPSVSDSP